MCVCVAVSFALVFWTAQNNEQRPRHRAEHFVHNWPSPSPSPSTNTNIYTPPTNQSARTIVRWHCSWTRSRTCWPAWWESRPGWLLNPRLGRAGRTGRVLGEIPVHCTWLLIFMGNFVCVCSISMRPGESEKSQVPAQRGINQHFVF